MEINNQSKDVEIVFKTIEDKIGLSKFVQLGFTADSLKEAIKEGLDEIAKETDQEIRKTCSNGGSILVPELELSPQQMQLIENELNRKNSLLREGCDCGEWIVYLDGIGYFTLSCHCRKSTVCPVEMDWFIDNQAYIYSKSLYEIDYDFANVRLLYRVNIEQALLLKEIANKALCLEKGTSEFGKPLSK